LVWNIFLSQLKNYFVYGEPIYNAICPELQDGGSSCCSPTYGTCTICFRTSQSKNDAEELLEPPIVYDININPNTNVRKINGTIYAFNFETDRVKMWIDWNNDSIFNNRIGSDEIIYDSGILQQDTNNGIGNCSIIDLFIGINCAFSFSKIIPPFVSNPTGLTMRIVAVFSETGRYDGNPCGNYQYGDVRDLVISPNGTKSGSFSDPHLHWKDEKNKNKEIVFTPKFPVEGWYNWISECDFFVNGNIVNDGLKGQQWNDAFVLGFENQENTITKIEIFLEKNDDIDEKRMVAKINDKKMETKKAEINGDDINVHIFQKNKLL